MYCFHDKHRCALWDDGRESARRLIVKPKSNTMLLFNSVPPKRSGSSVSGIAATLLAVTMIALGFVIATYAL